ncbi:hypothetical protein AAG570_008579 [Ranatra chinensis]|uniref:Uncharacterized protein n=1 Tax=Ranatra chinensis TaxID=642074 RepID=A0ABD0YRY1_9HEMI
MTSERRNMFYQKQETDIELWPRNVIEIEVVCFYRTGGGDVTAGRTVVTSGGRRGNWPPGLPPPPPPAADTSRPSSRPHAYLSVCQARTPVRALLPYPWVRPVRVLCRDRKRTTLRGAQMTSGRLSRRSSMSRLLLLGSCLLFAAGPPHIFSYAQVSHKPLLTVLSLLRPKVFTVTPISSPNLVDIPSGLRCLHIGCHLSPLIYRNTLA